MESKQMAQALIDLHNCLPYSSQDQYNKMPDGMDLFEYVQDLYENLLAELWEIANRFPPNSLECILSSIEGAVLSGKKPVDAESPDPSINSGYDEADAAPSDRLKGCGF